MVSIRRCEKYTVYRTTKAIQLDPERFRILAENPYTGNTDQEFVEYISDPLFYSELPDDLDIDSKNSIWELYSPSDEDFEEYNPVYKIRLQFIDKFLKSGGGKKGELLDFINTNLIDYGVSTITMEELNSDLQEYYNSLIDEDRDWLEIGEFGRYKGISDIYDLDSGDEIPFSTSPEDGC